MPSETINQHQVEVLIRRQDELERELNRLRDMYKEMKEKNAESLGRVHERIDKLERELADLRATLNELKESVSSVHKTVNAVEKHVSEINVKQDVAITAQDKFISQLWKAFFALLGVITVAGGAVFALLKL